MKSLIVGNGLDIEFGGLGVCGNKAILDRVHNNIQAGRYTDILKETPETLMKLFDGYRSIINQVIKGTWNISENDGYLFLLMEMERVRDYYKANPAFNEIGLEDYFLGHELSSHIQDFSGNKEQERQLMQMIILDAIYNEGKINELYKVFPDKLKKFLINYDAIFTLNYDTNLDSYLEGSVPIYHIHGSFDDISVGHEDEPEEWKHMYCNGIMTWYWVEKYGQEHSDIRYGTKEFSQIEDRVDIIGLSACNDEQLFVQLSQNGKLNKCDFYYYDSNDAVEIRKHLCGTLQNHITIKNVRNFWRKIRT